MSFSNRRKIVELSSDTQLTWNQTEFSLISVDTTSGNVTVTLPDLIAGDNSAKGKDVIFLNVGTNDLVIAKGANSTINGSASNLTLADQYESTMLVCGPDRDWVANVDQAGSSTAIEDGDFSSNGVMVRTGAGTYTSLEAVQTSAGAGDSGKVPVLNSAGILDESMTLRTVTTVVSASEMRDLHNTPVEVLADQGVGVYAEVTSIIVKAVFSSVAFDDAASDGDLEFVYPSADSICQMEADGLVDVGSGDVSFKAFPDVSSPGSRVPTAGPIIMQNTGAAFTGATADTAFNVTVEFKLLNLP